MAGDGARHLLVAADGGLIAAAGSRVSPQGPSAKPSVDRGFGRNRDSPATKRLTHRTVAMGIGANRASSAGAESRLAVSADLYPKPRTIYSMLEKTGNRGSARRPGERQAANESPAEKRLRTENAALRAELDRLRAQYESPVEPPARKKEAPPAPEPEQFALVGPGQREHDKAGLSDEALDSVGEFLCRTLEARKPDRKWRYYRDELLVPEGMTFVYAHDALRKLWGDSPGNPDPPTPQAHRRLTETERDERDALFQAALSRVDEALERSEKLHTQGNAVAAVGLLKYVDVLLARFNLALAQAKAGNSHWPNTLDDPERDAAFETWLAQQVSLA